jgi:sialic acid synthase SpsE
MSPSNGTKQMKDAPKIKIANRWIGPAYEPFVIAEVGINHNGDVRKALEMISVAKESGADVVKFKTFKADEFVGDPSMTYTYRSQGRDVTEPMLDMFRRYELPKEAWPRLKAECDRQHILFMSTPQNVSDLAILLDLPVPAIKVGSDDFTNLPLLKEYAATGLPLIISCGMANQVEIQQSLQTVGALKGYPTVLMLCVSQYPTPLQDVNLRRLATLNKTFPQTVLGFSDHTQGSFAAPVAVALRASVFEKHFTLDQGAPGPDHWFSEDPTGLKAWVKSIRGAYAALGSPVLQATPAEEAMRQVARRSIFVLRDISPGEPLTKENIGLRRPGSGLPPSLYEKILGSKASRRITKGTFLRKGDFR